MRKWLLATVLLAVALAPALAVAGAPAIGTYKTLTSTILPGKATESMPADMAEGQLGNMIWGESWNGVALGTEWKVMCPQIISPPVLIFDGVVNGTGQRAYHTVYAGGTMWLSGAAAWAGGDAFYTATLSSFSTVVFKQYAGGQLTGAVTNINLTGVFDGYSDCFDMAISNAEFVGYTPVGYPPQVGPFPPFYGPSNCTLVGNHGTYWTVNDITLNILGTCVVPSVPTSWGQLKAIYR